MTGKTLLKYFLIWQTVIIFISAIAGNFLPLQTSNTYLGGGVTRYLENPLLNFRSNFDGVHYVLIATHGYNYGQQAFFPFYSTLIRFVRPYILDPILGGVVISTVCFFIGLIFLHRLIRLDLTAQVSRWVIISLLVFPTSFFFTSVYTEGLFFMLTILAFYSARKSRWWLAGIFGAMASYTRLVGIFLFPALILELWTQKQWLNLSFKSMFFRLLGLCLIPLGILTYMSYLKNTTGDPFAFYHVQRLFGQDRSLSVVMPYQVYWRYIRMILTVDPATSLYYTLWTEFLTGIVFSLLTLVSIFRQRFSYAVFSLFAFAVPTFTGNLVSISRYVLVCFPVFMLIGTILSRYPKYRPYYLIPSVIVAVISLSLFVRGYWLA